MKKALVSAILLTLVINISYSKDNDHDTLKILNTFDQFNTWMKEQKFDSCATLIDSSSYIYLNGLSQLVYEADSTTLLNAPMLDFALTLTIRAYMIQNKLKKDANLSLPALLIGRSYTPHAPKQGLVNFNVQGNEADALLTLGGYETDHISYFKKEGDSWKIHLMSTFNTSKEALERMKGQMGNSMQEAVRFITENLGFSGTELLDPDRVR